MTILRTPNVEAHETSPTKSAIFINIVLLTLCVVALLVYRGKPFVESFSRIEGGHIYVEVSNWDIPVFASIPCFFALISILILRFVGFNKEVVIQRLLKLSVISALIAILIRLPIGYLNAAYLGAAGYSPCWQLSSPSLMAPTVWVSNSGYCVAHSGSVRRKALEWVDTQVDAGLRPTPKELENKVEILRLESTSLSE